jgi:hypothetical protein
VVQQRTPRRSGISLKAYPKWGFAILMAGILGGCAEPPVFHRNSVAILPAGSLSREWFVDLHLTDDPIVKIDVRDKLVYVYTTSKEVLGFDRKAGTLKMTMHVSSPSSRLQPLVELKDRIVFPNAISIEVFDDKGFFEKSIPLNVPLRSNASGDNETIYFGSVGPHGGLVEAYDVSQPYAPQQWEFMTRDTADVTAGTADYGGIVYSGSQEGEVNAVTSERNQIWDTDHGNFLVSGPITADLVVDESGVYVASNDTKLYCIDRRTGKLKWQYFAGQPLTESPVTTSDTVYQYVPHKGLAALDKLSGPFNRTPRWIHPTATQFLAQDEKYAYLADPRPSADDKGAPGYAIIAVDKQTMKFAFESDHKDFTVLGTNRKDSLIYAAFADGKFYAIHPVLKAGQIGELVMVPVQPEVAAAD